MREKVKLTFGPGIEVGGVAFQEGRWIVSAKGKTGSVILSCLRRAFDVAP